MLLQVLVTAVGFILIFFSGYWLRSTGHPYNGVLLNFHKLLGLALVIFLYFTVRRFAGTGGLPSGVVLFSIAGAVLFVLAIISGGLVSTGKSFPAVMEWGHKFTPYLVVLVTIVTFYLLVRRA